MIGSKVLHTTRIFLCCVVSSKIIICFQVCLQIFLFIVFTVFFAKPDVERFNKAEVIILTNLLILIVFVLLVVLLLLLLLNLTSIITFPR